MIPTLISCSSVVVLALVGATWQVSSRLTRLETYMALVLRHLKLNGYKDG